MGIIVGGMRAVALIVPLSGTGLLAISGHTPDSFPNPEFGPILGRKIAAYAAPVTVTQTNMMALKTLPSADNVEASAKVWLSEYKAGHLMPLPSVRSSDTTRDGIKGQILTARNVVIGHLIRLGDEAFHDGKKDLSLSRYRVALDLSRIARESDLNSLAMSLSFENAAWMRISYAGAGKPTTDPEDKERLGRLLRREFMHILRQPGVTSRDRMRMKRIYNIAQTKKSSFSEWLSTKDYELSLMLAAARRVESLLRTRERLSQGYGSASIGFVLARS